MEREHRQAVGREGLARRVNLDLVHRAALAVVRRRGAEEADPLARDLVELAIVVRALRQGEDPHQFAVHEQVIVDGQFVPRLEADARPGRIVIAEGGVGLGGGRGAAPRHRLARGVEDLDHRIDRRTGPPRQHLDDQPLALLRLGIATVDARSASSGCRRPNPARAGPRRQRGRPPSTGTRPP